MHVVNRWAQRHRDRLERDLEPDETLLAANRVMLVSASSVATWGDAARSVTGTRRSSPRPVKLAGARRLGFPLPGWIFVLGVSNQRLLIWRTTLLLGYPHELAASLPFDEIASVTALPRLGATRVSIVHDNGTMLVVQALWSRQLRDLPAAFAHAKLR